MSKLEVAMFGHAAYVVPDLEKSLWFWKDVVGLIETERTADAVYLRAFQEFEHHSLVLIRGKQGEEAHLHHVAFKAKRPEDVDAFAAHLRGLGVAVEEVPAGTEAGQGAAIRFFVPTSGHPIEIYYNMARPLSPKEVRSALKSQTARKGIGISPRRIDHINLWCGGFPPDETIAWMCDNLGFKVREFIQLPEFKLGAWMSVTPLVHDAAFMFDGNSQGARHHHIAYWLEEPTEILNAQEHFAEHGIKVDLGPGKHGISQAFYTYLRDPASGIRLEIFAGGYLIFDPAWEPIKWDAQEIERGLFWYGDSMDPTKEPEHPFMPTIGVRGRE
ncbi:VOC family protein [uncultured Bradyrhizobium sp.]|uniref:VOC family protein n=1 Tax=Bradyrhizobium sp. TaxID=376 RepID=UPI0026062952|nr:VOC family protein [uncultured Bradyrhizobium sp.]